MTYTFKLARRIARFRAPLLAACLAALLGCDGDNPLDPSTDDMVAHTGPHATAFAGGIPFGYFAMPIEEYGARYNGGHANIPEKQLLKELEYIKSRGGKVLLSLAGSPRYYLEGGRFSMSKWKQRIDRYRGINFSSYAKDGTIIGHYMIDEPNDPANWNGQPVTPSVIEEMAKYSKSLWPDMPTVVRVEPSYLGKDHKYVDAAWAQYLNRRGDAGDYIRRNVADAQARGLALIVGMNVLKGGSPNLTPMTASEAQSWGSALLSSTYPCAFISWEWDNGYNNNSGMTGAMDALRRLAQNRSSRSCRAGSSGGQTPPPPPPPSEPPPSEPPPSEPPPPSGGVLFGPHGLPDTEMDGYSGAVRGADPESIVATLTAARQAGAKVIVRLSGSAVSNSNGTFSFTKWKAAIDRYARVNLSSYLADGTLAGHLLVQNPHNANAWGGQRISHATLEDMARYSRQRFPGLTTIVHTQASYLASRTSWQYLDAASVNYNGSYGDAARWVGAQADVLGKARLGMVVSMNVLNGGTSRAGGKSEMSATQLRTWGSAFASHTKVCGLVLARYERTYFGRSDVRDAVKAVASKAGARAASSCKVR